MPQQATPLRKSIATSRSAARCVDKLEAAATVGFDGVEIMESDLLTFDGSPAEVRHICENLGLTIDIYQPFRDFEAMPEPHRSRNLDRAERKFDTMQALGTDLVLVCSNTHPATLDDDARAAADLAAMAERAARRGLRVGYEALSWARHVRLWRHAWRIVQQAGHPALGLIVDSFHTLALERRSRRPGRNSRRPHLLRAAGRRAASVDGCAVLEPPLPQLPGPGRSAGRWLRARGAGQRLSGTVVAGSIQRQFPRRTSPDDRARRSALVDLGRGAGTRPGHVARAAGTRWHRVPGIRGRCRREPGTGGFPAAVSAFTTPAATGPSRWSCIARAASIWC